MFKKLAIAIIGMTLLLMAGVFLFAKDIEVTISESEAQAAIDEFLQTQKPENFGISVLPKYISIDFKDGDVAKIESDMTIKGHGYSGRFDGAFSTGIDYRIPRIYLNDPKLEDGGFVTDDDTISELGQLKNSAVNVIERLRQDDPELNSKIGSKQSSDAFVEDMVLKSINYFFESVPIYDLRHSGMSGSIASLALKDVKFTEDTAIITLSPVTALLRILAAIGMVCLGIAYFLGPHLLTVLFSRNRENHS